jgi:hypothetical protein
VGRVAGTPLAESEGPREWQCNQLEDIGEHLSNPLTRFTPYRDATASGHGIGKSADIGMIVCWALDTHEDTRVVVTANTEPQIRTKLWPEMIKWRNLSITRDWWKVTKTGIFSVVPGHEESWRADAMTWTEHNTEAFAGLHNKGKRIVVIYRRGVEDRRQGVGSHRRRADRRARPRSSGSPTATRRRTRAASASASASIAHCGTTRQIDSRTVEGTNNPYLQSIVDTYGEDSDIAKVRVLGSSRQRPRCSSSPRAGRAMRKREVFADPSPSR